MRVDDENVLGVCSACADQPQEATDAATLLNETVPASQPKPEANPAGNCHSSYPDFCIPPRPPDLNCTSALNAGRRNFTVRPPDPHRFGAGHDGKGCESRR